MSAVLEGGRKCGQGMKAGWGDVCASQLIIHFKSASVPLVPCQPTPVPAPRAATHCLPAPQCQLCTSVSALHLLPPLQASPQPGAQSPGPDAPRVISTPHLTAHCRLFHPQTCRQAFSLVRTIRGLTLRLVDPQHSPAQDCQQSVAQVLPLLLQQVRKGLYFFLEETASSLWRWSYPCCCSRCVQTLFRSQDRHALPRWWPAELPTCWYLAASPATSTIDT